LYKNFSGRPKWQRKKRLKNIYCTFVQKYSGYFDLPFNQIALQASKCLECVLAIEVKASVAQMSLSIEVYSCDHLPAAGLSVK
jgi:hypothetical protein